METIIHKTLGIGDAGLPFDVSINVEYEKQGSLIIVTDWMEDKSPYDNPPQLWYERMEEIISDFLYEQDNVSQVMFQYP